MAVQECLGLAEAQRPDPSLSWLTGPARARILAATRALALRGSPPLRPSATPTRAHTFLTPTPRTDPQAGLTQPERTCTDYSSLNLLHPPAILAG